MSGASETRRASTALFAIAGLCALLAQACSSSRALTIKHLKIDEKLGQLVIVAAQGTFMNERSPAFQRLLHEVRDLHVGGVIWYGADVYETAWVNDRLQQEASIPLLISADLESGLGMRFSNTTFWPWAMAVAATGDPSFAETQGRLVAREAKLLGINMILAPVADVNSNPDNPVINVRSYGEDPIDVGRFVGAFIRGVQSEGVLATAKHFPGHGDTEKDSHRSLPTLTAGRERLDKIELVPFREAIRSGVAAVMTGHLAIPEIDSETLPGDQRASENPYAADESEINHDATIPSSLSRHLVDGMLREDLGFNGLVITDALDMGGITDHFNAGEAGVRTIEAGSDLALKTADTEMSLAGLREAIDSGRLPIERIDTSVRRILDAKSRLHPEPFSPATIFAQVDPPETRALAERIAQRAITLVRLEPGALPVDPGAKIVEISVGDFEEAVNTLSTFDRALDARATPPVVKFTLDRRSQADEIDSMLEAASRADLVVLALRVRTRSGQGAVGVPPAVRALVTELANRGTRTIGISFGSPYTLKELPELETYIVAYGVQSVMQIAAAKALYGEASIEGKLPVTIPGLAPRGTGIQVKGK